MTETRPLHHRGALNKPAFVESVVERVLSAKKSWRSPGATEHARLLASLWFDARDRRAEALGRPQATLEGLWTIGVHAASGGPVQTAAEVIAQLVGQWQRFIESEKLEFAWLYSRWALRWFGVLGLRDPRVVDTLWLLEQAVRSQRLPIQTRRAVKCVWHRTLNEALPSLKGKGKTIRPDLARLRDECQQVFTKLSGFKATYRNVAAARVSLKERFPELSDRATSQIIEGSCGIRHRYSKRRMAQLILGIRHSASPGTVRQWLIQAKQQQLELEALSKIISRLDYPQPLH